MEKEAELTVTKRPVWNAGRTVGAKRALKPVLSDQSLLVSTWRGSDHKHRPQAASDCHSARAAERRSMYV